MLKQNLQQKLGLKINPLQIQLIKLLELPTYQLEQRINCLLYTSPSASCNACLQSIIPAFVALRNFITSAAFISIFFKPPC